MFENQESSTVKTENIHLELIWIDPDQKIVDANQVALDNAAQNGLSLIGMPHAHLDPNFPDELLEILFSRKETALSYTRPSCTPHLSCEQCVDLLTLQEIKGRLFVVRCGKYLINAPPGLDADAICGRAKEARKIRQVSVAAKQMRSEFIANMNHEIRTPMNAIIGYAEMLVGCDLESREKRFAETIHKSGMTLVSILNDIMDLSKIESGRLKIIYSPVRLKDLVDESTALFQDQLIGKDLQLYSSISRRVPDVVMVDGLRLKQILNNLLSNAVKFTDKGRITLSVDADPCGSEQNTSSLVVSVEDTGTGISPADIETINKILHPSTDEFPVEYSGRGFGLPLCGRLVSMMGGSIELTSTLNKGTKIEINLPDIASTPERHDETTKSFTHQVQNDVVSTKLLVVDDMDLIKDVFIDYFSETDITILTASNGETALRLAMDEKPSIIFMDLNLAGKDGRAVTRELRANPKTEEIPVIAMTGNLLEESDYKPLFDEFLQKPFRLDTLQEIVATYCQKAPEKKSEEVFEQPLPDIQYTGLSVVWNGELNNLLQQAMLTGSLSAAGELGLRLKEAGSRTMDKHVLELGTSLIDCANEHDIMGVEQILTRLHHFTVSKIDE